jgi:hypothetical protein
MKIRDDPEHSGQILKRSLCGDAEEFLKYKEVKQ